MIFDCCHSLGQTRGPQSNTSAIRSIADPPGLRDDCVDDVPIEDIIDEGRVGAELSQMIRGGLDEQAVHGQTVSEVPHMLLAACQQDQQAFDGDPKTGGVFTSALLKVLKTQWKRDQLKSLTYAGIMLHMEINNRNNL